MLRSSAARLNSNARRSVLACIRQLSIASSSRLIIKTAPLIYSNSILLNPSKFVRPLQAPFIRLFASKEYPKHLQIPMPALSPTMTSGNIGKWNKQIGDQVSQGDVLVEIETDKATMDFESQEEGVLAKILVPSGAKDVPVNKLIAVLAESKADVPAFADYTDEAVSATAPAATPATPTAVSAPSVTPTPVAPAAPAAPSSAPTSAEGRIFASPLAKKLAADRQIPLSELKGTGPGGRIQKDDVLNFIPAPKPSAPQSVSPAAVSATAATPVTALDFTDIPLSKMRQIIASRLTESKQSIPHYYLTIEIKVDKLLDLRSTLNTKAEKEKATYKLSLNDFVVKAASKALLRVPEVNSSWQGDFIRRHHHADICVAVATEAGLITPIVHKADTKGLITISDTVKKLAAKAKENKLAPHEYQGGTFTISNLGMYGIKEFTAIINPPQACILAVGGVEKRVVPSEGSNGDFETASIMTVTLSCDHRVVDGAVGAQWLQSFRGFLEDPMTMLL